MTAGARAAPSRRRCGSTQRTVRRLHGLGRLDAEAQQLEAHAGGWNDTDRDQPGRGRVSSDAGANSRGDGRHWSQPVRKQCRQRATRCCVAALSLSSRLPSLRCAGNRHAATSAPVSPAVAGSGGAGAAVRLMQDRRSPSEPEAPRPIDANATIIQQATAAMQAGEATCAIRLLSAIVRQQRHRCRAGNRRRLTAASLPVTPTPARGSRRP